MSTPIAPSDLTQRPPRSMCARLGGFVLLPRHSGQRPRNACQEKRRIQLQLTYQHLVRFLGLDLDALLKKLATGKGDGEILRYRKVVLKIVI
jgi:hypothetical protein